MTLFGLAALAFRARRLVATAETSRVEQVPVLITDRVGPALVGIFRYDIVIPRWTLGLSAEQQSLIVAHERPAEPIRNRQANSGLFLRIDTIYDIIGRE